ncbi:ACOT7 [Bugula neritina]|uniref:ACOT7 n=1 Tax=Bugula neritina TaxID=10212 RepID=A0A7J7JTU5_BUGNE|nr:ACOT7 [Bugula neritina]
MNNSILRCLIDARLLSHDLTRLTSVAKSKYQSCHSTCKPRDSTFSDGGEDDPGYGPGYLTTDEFLDMNNSYRSVTLSRMMQVSETNVAGRVSAATLLKVFEETGSVVCTRYCNYTSSDQSLRTGNLYDQVHCGMVYVDYLELLLPAFAGELLTCVADIYFTSPTAIEVKSVIWSENLVSCNRRIVGKSSAWFVSFNVRNEWKLAKVPKLALDPSLEVDSLDRYEKYKEGWKNLSQSRVEFHRPHFSGDLQERTSKGKIINSNRYSEVVITHIVNMADCGAYLYMHCGSIMGVMEDAASMVVRKHTGTQSIPLACGYQFGFLELVPRGSMMIVYAHLTFTSKRLLEVEVIADIEVINNQSIETKRAAVGYFAFVVQVGRIPTLKLSTAEEEAQFQEGQKRFDEMRKHLKYTDKRASENSGHVTIDKSINTSQVLAPPPARTI